ncbi:unnamed protein product [Effrenium voratum]|nr:unnamed protein product [Effrenium voratum]
MNVLEGVVNIARRSVRRITQETWEDRTLVVRISNGTSKPLEVAEPMWMTAGCCVLSFKKLMPGETGTVRFFSSGGELFGNATSGCHHAGAVEFRLDGMRLVMAESCPFGQSTFLKSHRFLVAFESTRSLADFYAEMPAVFMGCRGVSNTACTQGICARVHAIAVESPAAADVVLLEEDLEQVEYQLDSNQQLVFAEWCLEYDYKECLGSVLFLAETQAVTHALQQKKVSMGDKAFSLSLLIDTFVTTSICAPSEGLGHLSSWKAARAVFADAGYGDFAEEAPLEAYIEESHMLLRSASVRCMVTLSRAVAECKARGHWPAEGKTPSGPRRPSPRKSSSGPGRSSIADFFRRSSTLEDSPSPRRRGCCSAVALEGVEREQLLSLVRHGVHLGAEYQLRRRRLLKELQLQHPQHSAALKLFSRRLGLSFRSVWEEPQGIFPEVAFNFFSSEVFECLGTSSGVSPEEVLQSLGHDSPEYRAMNTNSKSGELFFFSSDRRFILKTLSGKELMLLMRMMPAYLAHIQQWPRSLIVRYAGLYLIQWGEQSIHLMVMRSVFDPLRMLHLKFDLKGSLYKRRKKPGEGVGKDEDWVDSGHRLKLPLEVQRQFCAQLELDALLLESFKMMDYSILLGIHFVDPRDASMAPGWHDGYLVSQDTNEIYYIGIIDHSIKYGLKKQAENLFRVAQGAGDRASCVSADTYAERQMQFVYHKVVDAPLGAMDIGTEGRLRVDLLEAHNLIAADWNGRSDPYVTVKLGLCVKRTVTVWSNCEPVWNCSLYLPVHEAHREQEVQITVWDEDHVKTLRGNDDLLGRLTVPMTWILQGPVDLPRAALWDVAQGTLSLRCVFESAEDLQDELTFSMATDSKRRLNQQLACCVCAALYRAAAS